MRLESYNRLELLLMDQLKKCLEREVPLTDRQMFIKEPVIVMDMDLADARSQYIHPFFQGCGGEYIKMTGIEAKAYVR
jgi:hypothetical protein